MYEMHLTLACVAGRRSPGKWSINNFFPFSLPFRTSATQANFCTSLLRTMFASLARANERARAQNVRDFPQTNLDSEVNARFLLNEHGDPHFLFYKFNENNILNN